MGKVTVTYSDGQNEPLSYSASVEQVVLEILGVLEDKGLIDTMGSFVDMAAKHEGGE